MTMGSLPEETLNDLKKIFEEFRMQPGNSSKQDLADIVEQNSVTKLDIILDKINQESPEYVKVLSMKASLYYENAKISLNNNAIQQSKGYLEQGLNLIQGYENDPQVAFLYLRIINYLSYVLSRIGDLERAQHLLEKLTLEELKCDPKVYCTEDLFLNNNVDQTSAKCKINKLLINNMQMLGWIYGKLGQTDKYASMVHQTLQKELDLNDGDPIQWAIRCFRLASLFIAQNKWQNACYHLASAQLVLDPLEANLNPNNTLFKAQADLARVWVNYGLQLFCLSKKTILDKIWDEAEEEKVLEKSPETPEPVLTDLTFVGLEIEVPRVPIKEIKEVDDAKELFSHTHKWLKRARFYYTLRDYPIQYVNIILELSELYRFLSFYEKSVEDQYGIQKKRYETLETLSSLLKEVRPNCYEAVSIDIIKEIIEVQIELMNLNLKKLYNPNKEATTVETDTLQKRIYAVAAIGSKLDQLRRISGRDSSERDIEEIETNVTELEDSKSEVADDSKKKLPVLSKDKTFIKGEGEGTSEPKKS